MRKSLTFILCSLCLLVPAAQAAKTSKVSAPATTKALSASVVKKHEMAKRIIRELRDSAAAAPEGAIKLELSNGSKVLVTRAARNQRWNPSGSFVIIHGKEAAEPGVVTVLNANERAEVNRMIGERFDTVHFQKVAPGAFTLAYLKEMAATSRSARNELALRELEQ